MNELGNGVNKVPRNRQNKGNRGSILEYFEFEFFVVSETGTRKDLEYREMKVLLLSFCYRMGTRKIKNWRINKKFL